MIKTKIEKNTFELVNAPELKAIEKSKAEQIRNVFAPMTLTLNAFEKKYNDIVAESKKEITKETTQKAKELRLDIGKVRIETGKLKDKQKAYIKLEDKAIMGVHNILVWAVKEKEDKLKEIEKFFEIQELKRLEELQKEREKLISPFVDDSQSYNLSGMDGDVWNAFFEGKKKNHADMIIATAKAKEEKELREKKEAEERARIKKENDRLKKEAEERERKIVEEEKVRKAKEEKERIEREKADKIQVDKLKKEQAERKKLEDKIKADELSKKKAKELEELNRQKELNKGDSDKINDLIKDFISIKNKYSFESENNKKILNGVNIMIDKIIGFIEAHKE